MSIIFALILKPKVTSIYKAIKGLSTYEVQNNCCLFERLIRVKKNGIFLFLTKNVQKAGETQAQSELVL